MHQEGFISVFSDIYMMTTLRLWDQGVVYYPLVL